jgi:3-deoxy-manno-octulosonate cytidylyltransferase (CMP-KDO synthetase)
MTAPSSNAIAIIPARLGSTRFPAKALANQTGKPLVVHVCEQASRASQVARVVVATDADEIKAAVESFGYEAVMTSPEHTNGTSRLAEASEQLGLDSDHVVINVQGDEPEIEPHVIDAALLAHGVLSGLGLGTVVAPINSDDEFKDPNVVKAVLAESSPGSSCASALYFSRAPVPYPRHTPDQTPMRHIGIYAYTVGAIRAYLAMAPSHLEHTESLEQLRWLAHGCSIKVAIVDSSHTGIDTPEQYRAFVGRYAQKNDLI